MENLELFMPPERVWIDARNDELWMDHSAASMNPAAVLVEYVRADSVWLLFTGQDYYPAGGGHDALGVFYGAEDAAVGWATDFDVDAGHEPWDTPDWKHLAAVRDGRLVVVKAWGRGGQRTDEWKDVDVDV